MSTLQTNDASSMNNSAKQRLWLLGPIAIVGSLVANLLIRAIALALLPIPAGFIQLQMPAIIIVFTILGTLGAWLVFALMKRFAHNPIQLFRIVATIVLVFSLVPDLLLLSSPSATMIAIIVLMLMHVAACLVCIGVFTSNLLTRK